MIKLLAIPLLMLSFNAFAQSLCKNDEFIILSGEIGKINGSSDFVPNGKLVSICTDKSKEPFLKVVYRFGKNELIELEQEATNVKPFGISLEQHGFGENRYQYSYNIQFNRGKYTYEIQFTTGWMTQNLGSIIVSYSNKKIADIAFNRIDDNLDSIEFSKNKTKLFHIKK